MSCKRNPNINIICSIHTSNNVMAISIYHALMIHEEPVGHGRIYVHDTSRETKKQISSILNESSQQSVSTLNLLSLQAFSPNNCFNCFFSLVSSLVNYIQTCYMLVHVCNLVYMYQVKCALVKFTLKECT